jgi:hypothetical protein
VLDLTERKHAEGVLRDTQTNLDAVPQAATAQFEILGARNELAGILLMAIGAILLVSGARF